MFDFVPLRFWLIVLIAIYASAPARYIFDHWAASPARRDITKPSRDVSWRKPQSLWRSVAILVALLAVAIFIFTPQAEALVKWDYFLPSLISAVGAWMVALAVRGLSQGKVEMIMRGFDKEYSRAEHPKRFWAAVVWNSALGLCLLMAGGMSSQDVKEEIAEDRCFDPPKGQPEEALIRACQQKVAEYDDAIGGDASNSADYHNRALAYENLGNWDRAVVDYSRAIELDPTYADTYVNRGSIYLDTRRYDQAIADFTRAHQLKPEEALPLANRGIAYAWKNDRARAEKDFAAARAIDANNISVLRGEVVLAEKVGDHKLALSKLEQALKIDPADEWSLWMKKNVTAYQSQEDALYGSAPPSQ